MVKRVKLFALIGVLIALIFGIRGLTLANTSLVLPAGFVSVEVATGLDQPTDVAFLPLGDLLITERGTGFGISGLSKVRFVRDGVVLAQPVLTLSTNAGWNSGLLAIELDPAFSSNGFFYLWYATGEMALNWSGESAMRLSRFTYDGATKTADPASERIVLELANWGESHHGNSLIFDAEGNLYVAIGELWEDPIGSQDMTKWEGKVLRIRPNNAPTGPTYTIPADNPYIDDPNIPSEIYASGFRNPYTLARRSSDGLIVEGDVGAEKYEEINVLTAGANYGWPEREGPCPRGQYPPCTPTPAHFTDPLYSYRHDLDDDEPHGAVTGLAFYEGATFPASYHGNLFFADSTHQFIKLLDPATNVVTDFAENAGLIVRLFYQNEQLYYLDHTGKLYRIYYSGSNNQAPSATLAVDVAAGAPPLNVTFTTTAFDPDDTNLTYIWEFADGSPPLVTTVPTATHVYEADGTFAATLIVQDGSGGQSAAIERAITVYSGEFPTLYLHNLTDPSRTNFVAGDEIQYEALRSNFAGLDAVAPFTWNIVMHHNVHTHPVASGINQLSGTFTIPTDNHDSDWNLWYAFELEMQTDTGQKIALREEIRPILIDLTFETSPASVPIVVNGIERQTPTTLRAIAGIENRAVASENMVYNWGVYAPTQWQLPSGHMLGKHLQLWAPVNDATIVAHYQRIKSAELQFLPIMFEE